MYSIKITDYQIFNNPITTPMVLVFKTNIPDINSAHRVIKKIAKIAGVNDAHVDVEDWEKVLRIECQPTTAAADIAHPVNQLGFECAELDH